MWLDPNCRRYFAADVLKRWALDSPGTEGFAMTSESIEMRVDIGEGTEVGFWNGRQFVFVVCCERSDRDDRTDHVSIGEGGESLGQCVGADTLVGMDVACIGLADIDCDGRCRRR